MRHALSLIALAALAAPLSAQTWRASADAMPPAIAFGAGAAVAGDQVLIGRPGIASGLPVPVFEAGGVHVYERTADGTWAEVGMLSADGAEVGDGFGYDIEVSGNWLAVSASRAEDERGAVHVFERDRAGQWAWRAELTMRGGEPGDRFGSSLALHGDMLFVGAPRVAGQTGTVVAFRRQGAEWTEVARLSAAGLAEGDQFGFELAVAGEALLVGAPGPTSGDPQNFRPGKVIVFGGKGESWSEQGTLRGDSVARIFGVRLAASGAQAFVSSPFGGPRGGAVFQFRRQGGAWTLAATVTPPESNPQSVFGSSVAIDGPDLLVGAPQGGAGTVHVMRHDPGTGAWAQVQALTTQNVGIGTQLGSSVAAGGGIAVAGAPMADFLQGRVFLYERGGDGTWTELGSVGGDAPSPYAKVTGGEISCADGAIQMYGCQNVDLVAFLPAADLGAKRGIWINDIWGWTDPGTGREFAIVGRADATTFVEVTDPANPVYLGELPMHEGAQPNLWRDIKVYANHAFVVADGAGPHGMQVFDLTQLPNVGNPPVVFEETAHYDRIASAHNIVIDTASGFAYTVGNSMGGETCGGALHMVDIRDPANPTFAGCFGDPATGFQRTGYTHDAQCVLYEGPDEAYRGRQICFNASETALGIADVTDKENPIAVGSASYPNVQYAHQGWLSEDQRWFYLNDEGDELSGAAPRTRTLVFDISDLDDPVMVREFLGETAATDHNLYVKGSYMYQSNYVAGLRIIDISDPTNPVEVGYFDTLPFGENAAGFAGTWSNYPFFESGVIAVTSINEGLFLLRFRPQTPVP